MRIMGALGMWVGEGVGDGNKEQQPVFIDCAPHHDATREKQQTYGLQQTAQFGWASCGQPFIFLLSTSSTSGLKLALGPDAQEGAGLSDDCSLSEPPSEPRGEPVHQGLADVFRSLPNEMSSVDAHSSPPPPCPGCGPIINPRKVGVGAAANVHRYMSIYMYPIRQWEWRLLTFFYKQQLRKLCSGLHDVFLC